jgi:hypothetical protein
MALGDSGESPDYAALWSRLRSTVEGDAEYTRDELRRAQRRRGEPDLLTEFRLTGEADALTRILALMDEMAPEAAW